MISKSIVFHPISLVIFAFFTLNWAKAENMGLHNKNVDPYDDDAWMGDKVYDLQHAKQTPAEKPVGKQSGKPNIINRVGKRIGHAMKGK